MTDEGLVFIYGAFKFVPQFLYPSILSLLFGRQNKQAALKLYPKGGMLEDHRPQLSVSIKYIKAESQCSIYTVTMKL